MQRYQNMVFSTAMRLLANQTEAEDVAQETFLRAYDHFDELHSSPTAGGWLKRVATNLCLNHLSRYRALSPSDVQAAAVQFLPRDRRVEVSVVPEKK